jgi:CheY-like chemotaxis protein
MPKVLVVEDLEAKFKAVRLLIFQEFGIEPEWARSVSAAYGVVDQNWDLILLDMNFSVSDETYNKHVDKAAVAGIELLQFMSAQGILAPIVVITAHDSFSQSTTLEIDSIEALDELLRDSFADVYKGAVKVEYTTSDWHVELLDLIRPMLANAS